MGRFSSNLIFFAELQQLSSLISFRVRSAQNLSILQKHFHFLRFLGVFVFRIFFFITDALAGGQTVSVHSERPYSASPG